MTDPDADVSERRCPCGRGRPFASCCGRLIAGETDAATPEDLMRSRFSAFAVGDAAYLLATWAPETRPSRVRIDPDMRWTSLDVLASTGGVLTSDGTVEFVARFTRNGEAGARHERSRFRRHDGRWVYVDGDHLS